MAGAAEGWVGDYHLRGTLHVLAEPAHCQIPAYADAAGAPAEPLPASTQVTGLALPRRPTAAGGGRRGVRSLNG